MPFHCEEKLGVDLWSLSGSLQIQDVKELKNSISISKGNAKRNILDLSAVEVCDTAGLQQICTILKDAERQGIVLEIPSWPEAISETARILGIKLKGIE